MNIEARVGVLVNSHKHSEVVKEVSRTLTEFSLPYGHRALSLVSEVDNYVNTSADRGLNSLIVPAFPGSKLLKLVTERSVLPVIGIPIVKVRYLRGAARLTNLIQSHKDLPIAWVGANNGINAAILAVQISALSDPELMSRFESYKNELTEKVIRVDQGLQQELAQSS